MTTTPADLLAAAEEVLSSHDPACDHIWNAYRQCQWCHRDRRDIYVDQLARHILATVHPDDDEPVTVEKCNDLGLENLSHSPYHRHYRIGPGIRLVAQACAGGFNPCELWMSGGQDFTTIKSPKMKQVRQLLSALKVEVK